MTAQILPFPGCKAFAREALDKLKSLPDPRSNDQLVADYTAAIIRGAEEWIKNSPGRSLNASITEQLIEAGIVRK